MNDPTIREYAEELVSIGTGLSSGHPIGTKISDLARGILHKLDNAHWALDGWQQDFLPVREIPDPDAFTLGGPHAP